jgi:hypothetical protein
MIENPERRIGGLTPEEDRARLEGVAERRKRIRELHNTPAGDAHPLKRAVRHARAHRDAKKTESRDVDYTIARLLNGENPDDEATLARVRVLRERQAALPAELAAAEDALALAESRLRPVLAAEEASHRQSLQEAARAAERALNEKRKALSFEYHNLALRMAEIDRELSDPTEQMKVMAQLRAAGLA